MWEGVSDDCVVRLLVRLLVRNGDLPRRQKYVYDTLETAADNASISRATEIGNSEVSETLLQGPIVDDKSDEKHRRR